MPNSTGDCCTVPNDAVPVARHLVLVGAGHAHVAVLRDLWRRPLPGLCLTLITREIQAPYSGMLPGLIAGHYRFEEAHIDTRKLARLAAAELCQDEVIGIDIAPSCVICRDRGAVPYDLLSLDIGARPNIASVPGAAAFAVPVKPIDAFNARFAELVARVRRRDGTTRLVVVGGGAGGVELLLAVQHRLHRELGRKRAALSCTLISGAASVLPGFPAAFRRRFAAVLARRGIAVINQARVVRLSAGFVHLDDGNTIVSDEVLWATEAAPAAWLRETGLPLDVAGFLCVDVTLRAAGREDIFAAGDIASFVPRALPKSGVYAVRAGGILAHNLRATLSGAKLKPFHPQRRALYLVSTGDRYAVGTRNGITFAGAWVWRWKDYLDRRFMARFRPPPGAA
jgi:selenide,water dikinase